MDIANSPSANFLSWAQETITSGHLISIALICLLQYAYHTYRITTARRRSQEFSLKVGTLSDELTTIKKEHSLSCMENSILKEFLAQASAEQAFELLLRRYVPDIQVGFAAFVKTTNSGTEVLRSRGLSEQSKSRLSLSDELVKELQEKEDQNLHFENRELLESPLLAQLSVADRKKINKIFVFLIDSNSDTSYLFITSSLYPVHATINQQIQLVNRLMLSIADTFRQTQSRELHVSQLKLTKDMLTLRAVQDGNYNSPLEMLEAFITKLSKLVSSDGGALFLTGHEPGANVRPLVYSVPHLPAKDQTTWKKHHSRLAIAGQSKTQRTYSPTDLTKIGITSLIQTVVHIPLVQSESTIGSLCVSKRRDTPFSEAEMELIEWSADYLSNTILRVLNQVAVERRAKIDGLTQLANRREFDNRLPHELQRTLANKRYCSLMLCDLDHFKLINDTHGHQAGDTVLKSTAEIVSNCLQGYQLPDQPLIARYGGEEIAIILPGVDDNRALTIAESIRSSVEAMEFEFDRKIVQVTISIGISTSPHHGTTADELFAQADAALYRAKDSGRNRVAASISLDAIHQN